MMFNKLGQDFSIDERLFKEITRFSVEELKKKDQFKIFLVCGLGGSGKSVFANQLCALLDPKFNLDSIAFSNSQFKHILMNKPNYAISFDEAYRGISSRSTLVKHQKDLLRMFYEVRQLNQVIFLCTPSFFRLDEAFAVELADGLFHIYKKKIKEGKYTRTVFRYRYFNRKKKSKLYYLAKKIGKDYSIVHTNFKGVISSKTYVVNDKLYREKKFKSMFEDDLAVETGEISNTTDDMYRRRFAMITLLLKEKYKMAYEDISTYLTANKLPIARSTITDLTRKEAKALKNEVIATTKQETS